MLTTHNNNNNNNNNNKSLVLMNGKLQDVIWRPVNTRLRPVSHTPDKTNPTKNSSQRKRITQKEKNSMSKKVGLLEKILIIFDIYAYFSLGKNYRKKN